MTTPVPGSMAETCPLPQATPPAAPATPEFIGPYKILSLLGSGGMGLVYLAYDPKLQRRLAVKVMNTTHPQGLIQEALLQARVEHPAVCRVYQVGDDAACPYIAMQFIHGCILTEATQELTPREKAYLMLSVTDGVHAAHRQGLIHRDLKPANILVELDEAGGLHPYVVDFGLARDWEDSILSQPGVAIGSPAYMAPEQAQGAPVDPRTDVYALGATLYELLAGAPPFLGQHAVETLMMVVDQEAEPLQKRVADLPADLACITHKCLEKQPSRRYASAKDLRDDLQRFLDGEPILARRPGRAERLWRWIRKHKVASAFGATVLLFAASLTGLWIYSSHQAQVRSQWSLRFGQDVIEMESILRFGQMLPLHDTAEQRRAIQQHMKAIQLLMHEQGRGARAPGHFALGKGFLLLNQISEARRELDQAWNGGLRSPEVELALAQTLIEQFLEAKPEAEGLPDARKREERLQALRAEYRDPALRHIQNARRKLGNLSMREEARLAFAEERYDDAATLAHRVYQSENWRYDALVDAAMGYTWSVPSLYNTGKFEQARQVLTRALELLETVLRIAPSNDRALAALRRTWALGHRIQLQAISPEGCIQKAQEIQAQVLAANSEWPQQFVEMAKLHRLQGYLAMLRQTSPDASFQQVEYWAGRALSAQNPHVAAPAHEVLADMLSNRLLVAANAGDASVTVLRQRLLEQCDLAIATGRSQWSTHLNLGRHAISLAQERWSQGLDPDPELQRAQQALRRTLELSPVPEANQLMMAALCLQSLTDRKHGGDGLGALSQAENHVQSVAAAQKDDPNLRYTLGMLRLAHGDALAAQGKSPLQSYHEAQSHHQAALQMRPDSADNALGYCDAGLRQAHWLIRHGEDPTPVLKRCKAHLQEPTIRRVLGQADQIRMTWMLALMDAVDQQKRLRRKADACIQNALSLAQRLPRPQDRSLFVAKTRTLAFMLAQESAPQAQARRNEALVAIRRPLESNPEQPELKALMRLVQENQHLGLPFSQLGSALWDDAVFLSMTAP